MLNIEYTARACDICGSNDLEEINCYQKNVKAKTGVYRWQVRNVVCRICGFAFVSPSPVEQSVSRYYSDTYPYWQGEVTEFSIERRVRVLQRYFANRKPGIFVEIGPNATHGFRAALAPLVDHYLPVELNLACQGNVALSDLKPSSADVIAAYFVLEHVVDIGAFLARLSEIANPDALLIVEVPNLYIYGKNPAGIVWWEHTNHFSPRSLSVLAARSGFSLIEVSDSDCSRPFGFLAVFRKGQPFDLGLSEYETAKRCMAAGVAASMGYWQGLDAARHAIRRAGAGARIVFWAVNQRCADLLEGFDLPGNSVFVDSDPAKSDYLAPIPVATPNSASVEIAQADFFVIGSELYAPEILRTIENMRGTPLKPDQYILLSQGYAIERGTSYLWQEHSAAAHARRPSIMRR
jgi:Methyltransferase domain